MILRSVRRVVLVACLALVAGCQSLPLQDAELRHLPAGSTARLERALTFPQGSVSIHLKRASSGKDLFWTRRYAAYCKLELWERTEVPLVLQPDSFVIEKVVSGISPILNTRREGGPLMTASFGLGLFADDQDGSSFVRGYGELYLHSPRQPNLYRVTCGYLDDPWKVQPLSLAEMEDALAGIFTIIPAAP